MKQLRHSIKVVGPLLALVGVILSVWGTLLMSRQYHPFGTWKLFKHIVRVIRITIFSGRTPAKALIAKASHFADLNVENRIRTLTGLYILALSFAVQTLAAVLILIDAAFPDS